MSDWESEFGGDVLIYERFMEDREARQSHQNFRNDTWRTKDGRDIPLKDMDDGHLLNAYKYSGRGDLLKEMVVRLFEARIKEGT